MQYLLMIYTNEQEEAQRTPEAQEAVMAEYFAFTKDVREAGIMLAGEALHPTTAATTVRVRNGQISSTDGPFAETKEQLGGYYLLNCENLDEAIQWAAKIPGAREGSIEIRPIWEFEA
ncbi:MAG: YciI family protein [Anaerolineaceae bacterium]|nr:YciI family protein [Anaerolineaceae bacterium]